MRKTRGERGDRHRRLIAIAVVIGEALAVPASHARFVFSASIFLHACSTASAARTVVFEGTCDASGAIPLDAHRFALADDEDNVLRIYDADAGGPPLWSYDLTPDLELSDAQYLEADLEAATRIGDRAFWIASHARTKQGLRAENRLLFITTDVTEGDGRIALAGQVYRRLLDAMLADPRLAALGLAEAADRPPQELGGLNIEGMTATPDDQLWIGFRNPIPEGRALLVRVANPLEISAGATPRIAEVLTLALDGRGVRSMSWWRGDYFILAGSYAHERETKLFRWDGVSKSGSEVAVRLDGLNPEAFFTPEERDEAMILSDDGEVVIDGHRCKDLQEGTKKRFRGVWALRPRT